MISGSALVSLLVSLVIAGLIVYLLFWLIGICGLPEPFDKIARVLVALVAVIFLINLLLGLGGHPLVRWQVESRLIALEKSSQELLGGQKAMREELERITDTWAEFKEVYIPYLKLELEKQRERGELRRAIIEKSLGAAIVALAAFIGVAIWEHVMSVLHGVK